MLGNLENELLTVISLKLKSVKNSGKVVLGELDIDNGTNDGSKENGVLITLVGC